MIKRHLTVFIAVFIVLCVIIFIVIMHFNKPTVAQYSLPENTTALSQPSSQESATEAATYPVNTIVSVLDINQGITSPVQKDSISLAYGGKPIGLHHALYLYQGRYYIPLKDVITGMGGKYSSQNNIVHIDFSGLVIEIDVSNNIYTKDSNQCSFYKQLISDKEENYISLFDLTKMLGLISDWDINGKIISLFTDARPIKPVEQPSTGGTAVVRLEDVFCGSGEYAVPDQLVDLRVIADYLYSKSIPFAVAWIPRYKNPPEDLDNDLANEYSLFNIDFVYTLDYFIDRGGTIGLHGYTHQSGKSVSVAGIEFGDGVNDSESATRKRIESAISSAKSLGIPVGFFEFPHYSGTDLQFKIAEEYFDYLYEHPLRVYNSKVVSRINNGRTVKYIPTPLDYVDSKDDMGKMLGKINALGKTSFASFYFHPHLDYEYVKISKDETGRPVYSYSEDSLLHQIVNAIEKKGFRFVKISEL